jgi:hypothetical protein
MTPRFFAGLLLILFIVASGSFLAKAQKTDTPAKTEPPSETTGAKTTQPVIVDLSTNKEMYNTNEDVYVKAKLWATQAVTVCLSSQHPETSFSGDLYRAGYGKLDTLPTVVQLSRDDLAAVQHLALQPGQMVQTGFSLKKLTPVSPVLWQTGEYRLLVKFYLCGKTEQGEKAIPAQAPLRFMVLE